MAPGLMSLLMTGLFLYHVNHDTAKKLRSDAPINLDDVNNDDFIPSSSSSRDSPSQSTAATTNHKVKLFHDFLVRYNKTYANIGEYRLRFDNFLRSLQRHRRHGLGNAHSAWVSSFGPAKYGVNQFSDLSPDEFRTRYLTLRPTKKLHANTFYPTKLSPRAVKNYLLERRLPLRWDWRDMGVVTPVKNQGGCGACYATSVVAMIETKQSIRKNGLSDNLSVQQILDCKTEASGCNGGDPADVLNWLNGTYVCRFKYWYPNHCRWRKPKLTTEIRYPNVYRDQFCKRSKVRGGTVQIQDYFCKYGISELDILHYIHTYGPVTVAVDSTSWIDYVGGVIHHNCGGGVNHAVVIVGYEVLDDHTPRYIIKNSWGSEFGDRGYVYVQIGHGLCGIQTQMCGAFV